MAGNRERLAFFYDTGKVTLLEMVGEVAIPPAAHRHIALPGIDRGFEGFDRNPYLASFASRDFRFVLANVHLYYGSSSARDMDRRSLETYAVGRWADLERKSEDSYCKDVIALGDFNLPRPQPGDPIYDALTRRGLQLPEHSTQMGSNLASDKYYDQIAFFPGETNDEFTGEHGVFDFDTAVFGTLWANRGKDDFETWVRYFLSDHRPMWARFGTTG